MAEPQIPIVGIHFNQNVAYSISPIYLWDENGPEGSRLIFSQESSWGKDGEVWSVGDSKKCFHISLTPYVANDVSDNPKMKNIGWLSFKDRFSYKSMDYAARMVTHKEYVGTERPTPYINFIAHEGSVNVNFIPADPKLSDSLSSQYRVDFQDFLNYFYYSLGDLGEHAQIFYCDTKKTMFSKRLPVNNKLSGGKPFQYKGYWLLWNRTRLENEPYWNPPSIQHVDDRTERTFVAADTVLCGMPCRDKEDTSSTRVGNIDKGKGMAQEFGGSFPPREPIRIPMFLGPGTVTISPEFGKVVIYSKNQKVGGNELPYLKPGDSSLKKMERTISSFGGELNHKATVHSILEKFRNVDDWNQQGGLICERAYENGKYYEGQTPGDTEVPYKIDEIVIRTDWIQEVQSSGLKCAIVFVMAYASENAGFTYGDFITRFKGGNPSRNFAYVPLVKEGLTANNVGDYKDRGAFEFTKDYAYIINPAAAPNGTIEIPSREITVKMPGEKNTYQFAALIYRIVKKDNNSYRIDPNYNFPFEYWIGIRTVGTDGTERRMARGEQITESNKDSPNTAGGSIVTATENNSPTYDIRQKETHVRVVADAPSTLRQPPKGSYIRCYLLDLTRQEKIWSDARILLPYNEGDTTQSDVMFLMGHIPEGNEYQLYIQQYGPDNQPVGRPREVGPVHTANHTYDIQGLKIELNESDGKLTFNFSNLDMPNVTSDETFYYSFQYWVDDVASKRHDISNPSTPKEFQGATTYDAQLPKSATCDFLFTVYKDEERTNQVASYHQLHLTEHYIKSFTVTDIYRGKDKYSDDGRMAKVQFVFEAQTTLPADDKRYRCRIELHKFTDDVEETPAIAIWDFEEIHGVFKKIADSPIDIDRSTYVIFIQLIEKETNIGREKFYVFWEAPGRMASGTIICGDKGVTLSSPATRPNETRIEYRILRDGLLGVVESPWEMRTESMIGGVAVTHPAWIVRPRMVSFRLLVTAPINDMPDALQTLLEVLTAAPKKGLTINLQSSNELYLLSLDGYIQVGSPKIEDRDDKWAIVSVVLDCPNYAWKGYPLVRQVSSDTEVTLSVFGHYPPSVSIWIQPQKATDIQLSINNQKPLRLMADTTAPMYIQVHHDPITQKYSVTGHDSYPPLSSDANGGRNGTLRNYAPHSIHSLLLGDETKRPSDTANMLKLVEPESYLPIILVPQIDNTIKVEGGQIRAVEYTPYYAFWW